MPAVPHGSEGSYPRQVQPGDPNLPPDNDQTQVRMPSHQPSPGVLDTASHKALHVLPRRFLGPLPIEDTAWARAKRSRLHQAREKALNRIRRVTEGPTSQPFDDPAGGGGIRNKLKKIRVSRRVGGIETVSELTIRDVPEEAPQSQSHRWKWGRGTASLGPIQRWEGGSFDIGREFFITDSETIRDTEEEDTTSSLRRGGAYVAPDLPLTAPEDNAMGQIVQEPEELVDESSSILARRPTLTSQSTQESFVTARTEFSVSSTFPIDLPSPDPQAPAPQDPSSAQNSSDTDGHRPSESSTRQLIPDQSDRPVDKLEGAGNTRLGRLKSAIRKPSTTVTFPAQTPNHERTKQSRMGRDSNGRSKSVTFPMDPVDHIDGERTRLPGDAPPEHPLSVLAREGDEAEGTSAGAQAAALEDSSDQWDNDDPSVDLTNTQLRDRVLVKVGYHRDDGIMIFDEETQRRKPCLWMDPFEEYIVVLRKGRIELYQDYGNPLAAHFTGHLRLCFVIILLESHTSLSVFSNVDMTVSLATSASKLAKELENPLQRTNSTRIRALKDRVKDSKQAQWLQRSKTGTHVFIFKFGETSRAMDWYWKIWRELGGVLPPKFDIAVPSLSTFIRIKIPEDKYDSGGTRTQKEMGPGALIKSCWDMMKDVVDVEDLKRQGEKGGHTLDMELAWKSVDGELDWITYDTTVEGHRRNWAVLAGIVKLPSERFPRSLQLRPAHHGPSALKLETGTVLEEPPGIEGFVIQHHAAKVKERIYVASHDGNIFTSTESRARPPLPPNDEGSYPHDVFPEVHEEFIKSERRRMARFIEKSMGCIDLRSIDSVRLCEDGDRHLVTGLSSEIITRSFVAQVGKAPTIFEAASMEVAQEWVERLKALIEYWKRRHRVDARLRMDAIAMHHRDDPFAGTLLANRSDDLLADIWDMCAIKGCRSVCLSGRLYFKKKPRDKFRARYIVLTGGSIVTFKIGTNKNLYTRQHHYPLFGSYVYSGMLASDELPEVRDENALGERARVYQDGLQSSDGAEDTTFCVRLVRGKTGFIKKKKEYPWEVEEEPADPSAAVSLWSVKRGDKKKQKASRYYVPPLTDTAPQLLVFRARSKLERDRWVWAINAEMERQVRANIEAEDQLRNYGTLP